MKLYCSGPMNQFRNPSGAIDAQDLEQSDLPLPRFYRGRTALRPGDIFAVVGSSSLGHMIREELHMAPIGPAHVGGGKDLVPRPKGNEFFVKQQ